MFFSKVYLYRYDGFVSVMNGDLSKIECKLASDILDKFPKLYSFSPKYSISK